MALGASGGNTAAMIVRSSVTMVAIGGAIDSWPPSSFRDRWAFSTRRTIRSALIRACGLDAVDRRGRCEPAAGICTTRVDPVVALRDQ
jgi:hypothetical protein